MVTVGLVERLDVDINDTPQSLGQVIGASKLAFCGQTVGLVERVMVDNTSLQTVAGDDQVCRKGFQFQCVYSQPSTDNK